MKVVRRRLFWKIYLTLLASLIAAIVFMGAFFWFLGEAQREVTQQTPEHREFFGPSEVSLYASTGAIVASRGKPIAQSEFKPGHHWGPGHVMRLDLPGGGFVLTRFGPSAHARANRLITTMLAVAGAIGLAAYPVTALLTRRLEALRAGVARWGEIATPIRLDDHGNDEVALLARTFNTAAARIDALLRSQRALLANASHELRSPLARLRLAIEVGARDPKGAQLAEIVRNLAEMDQLVDEILLSSRLDHPDVRQDRRETIDLLGLTAEEGARFDATVTGEPTEINGDAILLRRLVRNLLENGIKHGRSPVAIEIRHAQDAAEIVVSDAGRGIAPADRERVFEPFYRPAGSPEATGGWGLGLALVRQIAERHSGTAICEADPAGGSRFVVRLRGVARPTG